MRCEICGEKKQDVQKVMSPASMEMYGKIVVSKLCDSCYEEELRNVSAIKKR